MCGASATLLAASGSHPPPHTPAPHTHRPGVLDDIAPQQLVAIRADEALDDWVLGVVHVARSPGAEPDLAARARRVGAAEQGPQVDAVVGRQARRFGRGVLGVHARKATEGGVPGGGRGGWGARRSQSEVVTLRRERCPVGGGCGSRGGERPHHHAHTQTTPGTHPTAPSTHPAAPSHTRSAPRTSPPSPSRPRSWCRARRRAGSRRSQRHSRAHRPQSWTAEGVGLG